MKAPILYLVVPCYNEEECLRETRKRLIDKIKHLTSKGAISAKSRVVFVDDGSIDATWKIISEKIPSVIGLKLAHNRGHQNALLAGLFYAKEHSDIVISLDADLQDDINAIDSMVKKYHDGYEVVYGVRSSRKKDTAFKRTTAQLFYKIMKWLGVEVIYNSADYRLMSKRALDELENYSEVNLFLRGIVPLIGLKSTTVEYERAERFAGKSKYPLKKMLNFAWDGITSFSVKPIRFVLNIGVVILFASLLMTIYSVVVKIMGKAVDGWTFIVCSLWILGGIQMISIGLIGEYVGKIYAETKRRPRFFIEKVVENPTEGAE